MAQHALMGWIATLAITACGGGDPFDKWPFGGGDDGRHHEGGADATPIKPTPVAGGWWKPVIGLSWQIQYSGDLDLSLDVDVYNLDLFETSAADIEKLHADGKRVICYFGGGNWENWRPDAAAFPEAVLGSPIDGWAGERWIDTRQIETLKPIMTARMDLARQKKCDAVDPDVMDGWQAKTGFPIGYDDQIAYNVMIADEAHARGLGVSLKNDLEQIKDLLPKFDFAVNEECAAFNECENLRPFIDAGKPVFGIQYEGTPEAWCPKFNALNFDSLFKKMNLDAYRIACRERRGD